MTHFILKTKIIVPQSGGKILRRERLIKILEQGITKKLVLISADAGYGKTTLLANFAQGAKYPVFFYDLDYTDNDFVIFIRYLVASIRTHYFNFGDSVYNILRETKGRDFRIIMGTVINELLEIVDKPIFIIFDDYNRLDSNKLINQAVDYLLRYLPNNIHVVISSRTIPPLAIDWLRSKNMILVLDRETLKFTPEEIKDLFNKTYKSPIDHKELEIINQQTSGWITGLTLYHQAKGTVRPIDAKKVIFSYFAEEIFQQQSKAVQDFLVKSSILQPLCPQIVNTVLEIENSPQIFEYLEQNNLFVSHIDGEERCYKYHALFREFLKNKYEEGLDIIKRAELHKNAAKEHVKSGNYMAAFEHYLKAGDKNSAQTVLKKWAEFLYENGKLSTLSYCLKKLSVNLNNDEPDLLFYKGVESRFREEWEDAKKLLQKAARLFKSKGNIPGYGRARYHLGKLYAFQANYKKTINLATTALCFEQIKNTDLEAGFLDLLALSYETRGDYQKAIETYRKAVKVAEKQKNSSYKILCYNNLGYAYFISGEFEKAAECFFSAESLNLESSPYLPVIYFNMASQKLELGQYEHAKAYLEKAEQKMVGFCAPRHQKINAIIRGKFAIANNDFDSALKYFNRALELNKGVKELLLGLEIQKEISNVHLLKEDLFLAEKSVDLCLQRTEFRLLHPYNAVFLIIKGRICLYANDYVKAEKVFLEAMKIAHRSKMRRYLAEASFYLAKIYILENDSKKATLFLKKVFIMAREINLDNFLIQEGKRDFTLFELALQENMEPGYLQHIIPEITEKYDLKIYLFGGLKILDCGGNELERSWRINRAKSLFCFLIENRGKGFTKDKLMDILWEERELNKARRSFSVNIYWAKKQTHPQIIIYKDKRYFINSSLKLQIDTEEFKKLVSKGKSLLEQGKTKQAISKYQQAQNIYQGRYLPEIYERWSEKPREFYETLYIDILWELANWEYQRKSYKKAIKLCRQLLKIDPYHEETCEHIIKSYLQLGNQKKAKLEYGRFEKLFKDELGIKLFLPDIRRYL